jgi:hypothetical protein
MALFNLFGKKLKGENKYFKFRIADQKNETNDDQQVKKTTAPAPREPQINQKIYSERIINKTLLTELLKLMRNHDINATVTLLANTIDSGSRKAGIMINKGYIPKRIVNYLQNINMRNIEDAIKLIRTGQPDEDGFFRVDESTAANLNLPLGCMLLGIFHHLKQEFAVILVLKTTLKNRQEFVGKVKKLIKR